MSNLKLKEYKLLYKILLGNIMNFILCCFFVYAVISKSKINQYTIIILVVLFILSNGYQLISAFKIHTNLEKFKEDKKVFDKVIEVLPNAVFIHKKLKFIYANKEGAKFFNLEDPKDLIGRSVNDFVKLNTEIIGEQRLNNALNENNFQPLVENLITKASGEVVEVEAFSAPLKINGKITVLNILKDITEQKELEKLQKNMEEEKRKLKEAIEIDRLRNEFFSNLSHELRTPLTIIFGTIQLLEKEQRELIEEDLSLGKRLKTLKQNCYRLLRLINNLIDMTKIDAGYFNISLQNHNIIPIIEDISLSVVEYAENKGITIEFDTEIEEKVTACDPDKIERVMLNLLSNAIKFTKSNGKIKINIYDEKSNLKVVVEDDGIGIPSDKLNSIFDRFVQVDKSFTRNHEGSGLGLSIVKSFVEMQGGNIKAESKSGEGTKFIISIPIILVEETADAIELVGVTDNHVERVNIEFSDIYS